MRVHNRYTFAALALCLLSAPALAQQNMKPGLWEIHNKMGGSGNMGAKMAAAQVEMQKQLAAMPPEQRKQMEKIMADKGVGMSPGAGIGSDGNMAVRVCISKEMAARNEPPATGEGEYIMHSPESYTMKMKTTGQVKGKAEEITMEAQGKFISSDCGNLKPLKG